MPEPKITRGLILIRELVVHFLHSNEGLTDEEFTRAEVTAQLESIKKHIEDRMDADNA